MKLNLLPSDIARGSSIVTAIVISALMVIASFVLTVFMIVSSQKRLDDAKAEAAKQKVRADYAVAVSNQADEIVALGTPVMRNINLANAIQKQSDVYPDAYNYIKPYIPSFYRIFQFTVTPAGGSANVTMSGVIHTRQQYSDLLLALLRIPGAAGISRSPMPLISTFRPGISPFDQVGRPRLPSDAPIADDPEIRLNQQIAKGGVSGFDNAGAFGSGDDGPRGSMPGWTQMVVRFAIPRDLVAPNVRATLAAQGSAPGGGGGGNGRGRGR